MNGKRGLGRIMSALLAASSMIGGASAAPKKKNIKKPKGKVTSEYSFLKDPRSYGEAILGLSMLGLGGAAIHYRQGANLHKRFADEVLKCRLLGLFACKSVEELCDRLYAGKGENDEIRGLQFWRYEEINNTIDEGIEIVGTFGGYDRVRLNKANNAADGPLKSILICYNGSDSLDYAYYRGYVRIGNTWVDIMRNDELVDIALRFAFYYGFLMSCIEDNLTWPAVINNYEESEGSVEEGPCVVPKTQNDGLLDYVKKYVKGDNRADKEANIKKLMRGFVRIDMSKTYFLNILNLYRVKRKFIELCFGVI